MMLAEFNNRGGVHEEVKRDATMASIKPKMGKREEAPIRSLLGTKRRSTESIRTRRRRTTAVPKKLPRVASREPGGSKDN